ncbi:hypothetical protein [Rhizobium ruizarguesonis]|uniref:hypothetical protein n=1 Tax=Rhizobium ruizarguesonis TaxID=2081791 RepID=UPI001CF14D50|nr:hypothetical protein [Rhizobium ruizarguesonis]MCB2403609.1 hypothetical protein [Rhizobium ruizarguesonis]
MIVLAAAAVLVLRLQSQLEPLHDPAIALGIGWKKRRVALLPAEPARPLGPISALEIVPLPKVAITSKEVGRDLMKAAGPLPDWQLQAADLQGADIRVGAEIVVT